MTRVLQISDPHIGGPGTLSNGVVDTARALECAVTSLAEHDERIGPIDLVIVTGDLTDHGSPCEYAEFKRLIAPLTCPVVAIPGNHDRREEMRSAFAETEWMPDTGYLNLRIDLPHVTVLALDTVVSGKATGTLAEASLDWLADQIADVAGADVLLAMHHPPISTGIPLMDRQGLSNSASLHSIIASHAGNCRLVAGHAHRAVMGAFAGHPVYICPGTSHAVTADLRPEPSNTLTLEPGGLMLHRFGAIAASYLLPVGHYAGPYPFKA